MNIRFYNAKICTMENGSKIIDGEIHVSGNKISYVGEKKDSSLIFKREIDASGCLILPGFKNAHTHSPMTFLRSFADDLPLLEWLNKQVFPMEAKLRPEHIEAFTKLAIMEYLTSGITAQFDMYMFPKETVKASIDCGFRTVLASPISNFVSNLKTYEEEYHYFKSFHELVSIKLSFHAEYTCDIDLLKGISSIAKKYKEPVYTHNSESKEEVEDCIKRTGKTPTKYLDDIGLFMYGGGGYHCVHVTDEDLKIFKNRNMYVITNPASNVKLASGIAPIGKMLNMGIPVAIGTDGAASNNSLDMFKEMFLVTGLQKILLDDASAVPSDKVLEMATTISARAMGLNECDTLSEGKFADLIMIDLNQPNMQPLNNIIKNIVYSGSKQNVKLTMINGKILYEDNKFNIGVDPQDVYKKVNEIINEMKGSI